MNFIPRIDRRFSFWLILFFLVIYLLLVVVRSWFLLSNGRQIGQHSQAFNRDYYVGDKTAAPLTYLVMGDSTAAGWGARDLVGSFPNQIAKFVAEHGYRVHVINVAIGGARLSDLNREQLPALKRIKPDLITISIGANDTTRFTSENDYSCGLQSLLNGLRNSGNRKILIANTPDMYQAPALTLPLAIAAGSRARRQNGILDAALKGTKLQKVDLYDEGKLIYRQNKSLYANDLFHPSSEGYRLWAKLFIQKLGEL